MFLALGDCNVLGAGAYTGKTYIQIIQKKLKIDCINCGHTMSTTREGLEYFHKFKNLKIDFAIIGYGLVDSWQTFKYAPYVLYYPNTPLRKIARKLVKKYKKIARSLGLNKILGVRHVVSMIEFRKNLEEIIKNVPKVFLVETTPHKKDTYRNKSIKKYNDVLKDLANGYSHVQVIKIYKDFESNNKLYFDDVHFNSNGHELIAQKILDANCDLFR